MPASSTIDVFSTTNSAFGALLLWRFASGYSKVNSSGVELPLLYLPMPLLLSADLLESFAHTNSTSGFMSWINRAPHVPLELPRRLPRTAEFSRNAIAFALRYRLLRPTSGGFFVHDTTGLKKSPTRPASMLAGRQLSLAERLGKWMADVPSSTVFYSLGLTI